MDQLRMIDLVRAQILVPCAWNGIQCVESHPGTAADGSRHLVTITGGGLRGSRTPGHALKPGARGVLGVQQRGRADAKSSTKTRGTDEIRVVPAGLLNKYPLGIGPAASGEPTNVTFRHVLSVAWLHRMSTCVTAALQPPRFPLYRGVSTTLPF